MSASKSLLSQFEITSIYLRHFDLVSTALRCDSTLTSHHTHAAKCRCWQKRVTLMSRLYSIPNGLHLTIWQLGDKPGRESSRIWRCGAITNNDSCGFVEGWSCTFRAYCGHGASSYALCEHEIQVCRKLHEIMRRISDHNKTNKT